MKKILLGTLALVLIFALTGWATNTRVITLGDANNIVKDEANIWLYPSTINMYPNLALGEFATYSYMDEYEEMCSEMDFESLGMHYKFGEESAVLGLYLSKASWEDKWGFGYNPDPPRWDWEDQGDFLDGDGVDHRITAFFGTPMGDNQFGAALSWWGDSYSIDGDADDKTAMSNMILDFAVGLTMNENLDLAATFGIQTWTNEDDSGKVINEPNGCMHLGVTGRYWMDFGNDYVGIPHASLSYESAGAKGTFEDEGYEWEGEEKFTVTMIDIGWGMNLNPDERILVIGDLGFSYMGFKQTVTPEDEDAVEQEYTGSDFILPYFRIGLEGHVTNWWDVRVGAHKMWQMLSLPEDEDISHKFGQVGTDIYVGSGIHLGNLTLDVQIDPNFVGKGPNFVSGYNGALANRVSLKYNFGE